MLRRCPEPQNLRVSLSQRWPWMRRGAALAWLLMATGCGDSAASGATADAATATQDAGSIALDIAAGLDSATDDVAAVDSGNPATDQAGGEDGAPDNGDGADGGAPLPGGFGAPCSGNEQCDSGYCVPSAAGSVCSQVCETTCPGGFKCAPKTSPSGDITYLCVPGSTTLCDPCLLSADCNDATEVGNVCLQRADGQGRFCGVACGPGKPACPQGYDCSDETDPESGKTTQQCVPGGGSLCPCSAKAVSGSKSTVCSSKNFYGTCKGTRSCTAAGLTACSAPVPAPESCNGIDDDCNGQTDELTATLACVQQNEFGSCKGKASQCIQGQAICDAPQPKPEQCNGFDDDCDGQTDEALCDDGNPCTVDGCNTDGSCKHVPQSGQPCDDGSSCTTQDQCAGGVCTGVAQMACDDGNPCTLDGCAIGTGCTHTPKDGACADDGQPCTQDLCLNGTCSHPPQSEGGPCPDDGSACTQDVCSGGACLHPAVADGTACLDDGNGCTSDACVGGKCAHPPVAFTVPCADDANACTADLCDKGACSHPKLGPDKTCLDDGNPCTQDVCVEGACSHPAAANAAPCLDDGIPCTDDVCNSGQCTHPANQKPCLDDGQPCTLDVCKNKVCTHEPGNLNAACADDGNICTKDLCQNGKCAHPYSSGNKCDDGNPCSIGEFCDGASGNCKSAATLQCNDNNPCTKDKCVAYQGCVFENADGQLCDDGNACTTGDKCLGGACSGAGTKTCDDGNPCTTDNCSGGCTYTNNQNACADDGNPCTQDICSGGSCSHPSANNGMPCGAASGNPCVEGLCQAGKCSGVSQDGKLCNDGNACTSGDKCQGGVCQGAAFKNCDDGNPCTADSCDKFGSCIHQNSDGQSCVAASGACPSGQCVGGSCQSKPGVVCQAEYDVDLCASVQVPGTCAASGKCVANKSQPGFTCPGCNGICVKCTLFGGFALQYCLSF